MLIVEIVLTIAISVIIVLATISSASERADLFTNNISSDYNNLENNYVTSFSSIIIQIEEKIKEDPSFDEMNTWLQNHNSRFKNAIGSNVYDGIALTYKGGFAHSWDYGDYSNYDPSTRPWYQQAQKGKGKVVVVAPYVTYTGLIEMTIAKKYSKTISFDLDLKTPQINSLLKDRNFEYKGTTALLFDKKGYILSSTDSALYCHNINNYDKVISKSLSSSLKSVKTRLGKFNLMTIDGKLKVVYAKQDSNGNTYCVMYPFMSFILDELLVIGLILLLLIILEIAIYMSNKRKFREMEARDNVIHAITREAFQRQINIDIETMVCTPDDRSKDMVPVMDYHTAYKILYDSITVESSRNEFEQTFAPDNLINAEGKGLITKNFNLEFVRPDNTRLNKTIAFSIFVAQINNRKTAMIMGKDVTAEEKEHNQILKTMAYYYSNVFLGDVKNKTMKVIKTDIPFDNFRTTNSIDYEKILSNIAHNMLKEEYIDEYLNALSFETIEKKLAETDGYSITAEQKDGHWKTFRIIRGDGYEENHHFIYFVENVDDQLQHQKELEEALSKANDATRAKTDFLSRMSHDIRTPMNGIIGMTYIAKEQNNPEKTDECLDKIQTSSEFLLGLVNDILDLRKVESGSIELHPEPYLMSDFDKYIDAVIKPLYEDKDQQFIIDTHHVESVIPIMDILRFNQIVFNLLSNAVKYTPEHGTIKLLVNNKIIENHKERITIVVSDNGIGMSKEFQSRLFDEFTQESRNDNSVTRGSGLGLAIVKKMVDIMDGTISVESEIQKGSKFTVVLDFDYIETEQSKWYKTVSYDKYDTEVLKGKHLLLCEDHPMNQEIAKALLTEKGIIVETADNGAIAVEKFTISNEGFYDFVLMDVRMPVMNGYEATENIRSLDRKDAKTVPIIAMTADAFTDAIKRSYESGMNYHLAKPLNPDLLFFTLVEAENKNPNTIIK